MEVFFKDMIMILIYIVAAGFTFYLKHLFFDYIDFKYDIFEDGFNIKKFAIDMGVFFIFYTICLFVLIVTMNLLIV